MWLDIEQADSSATVDNSTVNSKAVQEFLVFRVGRWPSPQRLGLIRLGFIR